MHICSAPCSYTLQLQLILINKLFKNMEIFEETVESAVGFELIDSDQEDGATTIDIQGQIDFRHI